MKVYSAVFTLYKDDLEKHGSARQAVMSKLELKHPNADEIGIDELTVDDGYGYKVAAVTYSLE